MNKKERMLAAVLSASAGSLGAAAGSVDIAQDVDARFYIKCRDFNCPDEKADGCPAVFSKKGCLLYCWDGSYYSYLCC